MLLCFALPKYQWVTIRATERNGRPNRRRLAIRFESKTGLEFRDVDSSSGADYIITNLRRLRSFDDAAVLEIYDGHFGECTVVECSSIGVAFDICSIFGSDGKRMYKTMSASRNNGCIELEVDGLLSKEEGFRKRNILSLMYPGLSAKHIAENPLKETPEEERFCITQKINLRRANIYSDMAFCQNPVCSSNGSGTTLVKPGRYSSGLLCEECGHPWNPDVRYIDTSYLNPRA